MEPVILLVLFDISLPERDIPEEIVLTLADGDPGLGEGAPGPGAAVLAGAGAEAWDGGPQREPGPWPRGGWGTETREGAVHWGH